jgi:hypothetical protein
VAVKAVAGSAQPTGGPKTRKVLTLTTQLYRSDYFTWSIPGTRDDISGPIETFYPFLDQVYQQLSTNFGFNLSEHLPQQVTIQPSSNCSAGFSGSSSGFKLTYCAGNWAPNHWCYGLLIQELVNSFTGKFGGWPRAWWANGRSPFPTMIATQFMSDYGLHQQYLDHYNTFKDDPWFRRFWGLQQAKGWGLWKSLFQLFQEQGVQLGSLEEPVKSSVVMAYISFLAEWSNSL